MTPLKRLHYWPILLVVGLGLAQARSGIAANLAVGAPPPNGAGGAAVAAPVGEASSASTDQTASAVSLPGQWHTFANGDDVLTVALDGQTVWVGARAGGLVRWNPADGSYIQFLRPQDPLAGNTVRDIAIDGQGRKWIATNRGLTMLDDKATPDRGDDVWRTYTSENTFGGLPSDDVRAVEIDGNTVWVGTHQIEDVLTHSWSGGGLGGLDTKGTARTDDDTWAPVATFDGTRRRNPDGTVSLGLVSDNVNALKLADSGRLWVATSSHHIFDDESGKWPSVHGGISLRQTEGTPDPADDTWTGFSCEDDPLVVACHVLALDLDADGWMWAGTRGRGLMYWRANGTYFGSDGNQRFTNADGLLDTDVMGVAVGSGSTIWAATAEGLSRLDHNGTLANRSDDTWASISQADGLPRKAAQAVAFRDGQVWVGMGPLYGIGGGLVRLGEDGTGIAPFETSAAEGGKSLPSNFLRDVAAGPTGTRWAGHVWIATGSSEQRLFGEGVVDLDTKGTTGTADDTWTPYTAASTDDDGKAPWSGLAGNNVHAVAIDGDNVWFGSTKSTWNSTASAYDDGGLSVFDGTAWTSRTPATSELSDAGVSSLAVGCDGALWIGTGSKADEGAGVNRLDDAGTPHILTDDTWTSYVYPDVASNRTSGLAVNCDAGEVWMSGSHQVRANRWSDGGAAVFDVAGATWTKYDTRDGLVAYANDGIRAEATTVETGPGGTAWVGAYGTADTTEPVLIQTKPYWPAVLNTWDGSGWTPTVFEHMGFVSDVALDPVGQLWVTTSRGGAARDSIHPENWREDRSIPGVMLKMEDGWHALDAETTGLPANDIVAAQVAPDGTIWLATEGWGMSRYDPREAAPTPTPTNDAPRPTPSSTPSATPTRGAGTEATPTGTPSGGTPSTPGSGTPGSGTPGGGSPTRTPTRTGTAGPLDFRIFAPAVHQSRR